MWGAPIKRDPTYGAQLTPPPGGGTNLCLDTCQAACSSLLRHGANASTATPHPSELTALLRAASKGHAHVVRMMVDAGANVNQRAGAVSTRTAANRRLVRPSTERPPFESLRG